MQTQEVEKCASGTAEDVTDKISELLCNLHEPTLRNGRKPCVTDKIKQRSTGGHKKQDMEGGNDI